MAISLKDATEFDRSIEMLSFSKKGYFVRQADNRRYDAIDACSYIIASIGPKVEPNCGYKTIFEPYSHKRFRLEPATSKSDILASTIKRISKRLEDNSKTDSRYYVIYIKGKFIRIRK